jgi:DNA-binding IscR family transcriptional regulator
MWMRVRDAIVSALDSTTLADLVPAAARMSHPEVAFMRARSGRPAAHAPLTD